MPRKTSKPELKAVPDPEPDAPLDAAESPAPADEPAEPQNPNGVLILKLPDDQGGVQTDVVALGEVQPTEVATLIELGLARWRAKIGLDT